MEPSGFLIKRLILRDSAGFVKGAFAHNNSEFLTASDERFRPVNGYTAPDGTLYFIDMHRGVIQHTTYLTPYLRSYIDSLKLERPVGMGRIYRVKWKGHALSKKLNLSQYTTHQLVNLLEHKNGWYRDMAQRLLVDRADVSIKNDLIAKTEATNPVTALHAVYTLEGLQALTPQLLEQIARRTQSRKVYIACMKLLESFPADKNALAILEGLTREDDPLMALQLTNSLPYFEKAFPKKVKDGLQEQLQHYAKDTLFIDAFVSSASGREQQRLTWLSAKKDKDTTLKKLLQNTITRRKQAKLNPVATLTKNEAELWYSGKKNFERLCATCHGPEGDGFQNVAPPLAGSQWVNSKDATVPIRIILDGMSGPVDIAGKQYAPPEYNGTMPGLRNAFETNNGDIASILTYIRNAWNNKATAVTVQQVASVRKATETRTLPYTADELQLAINKTAIHEKRTSKKTN